jgi:hypothetical protein
MPENIAERQAKYRKLRPTAGENGERRINTWVTTATALALKRLARRYCVTQREMLERLILELDDDIRRTLNPDEPEWDEYYGLRSNDVKNKPIDARQLDSM